MTERAARKIFEKVEKDIAEGVESRFCDVPLSKFTKRQLILIIEHIQEEYFYRTPRKFSRGGGTLSGRD